MDCACTISFFTKKYNEMCDFCCAWEGGVKVISACGTTLLLALNKSLSNDQSDWVFCHMITNLYKSLMTKMIISNAKGFQIDKYNYNTL